jgi:hypothetical protein
MDISALKAAYLFGTQKRFIMSSEINRSAAFQTSTFSPPIVRPSTEILSSTLFEMDFLNASLITVQEKDLRDIGLDNNYTLK